MAMRRGYQWAFTWTAGSGGMVMVTSDVYAWEGDIRMGTPFVCMPVGYSMEKVYPGDTAGEGWMVQNSQSGSAATGQSATPPIPDGTVGTLKLTVDSVGTHNYVFPALITSLSMAGTARAVDNKTTFRYRWQVSAASAASVVQLNQ